MDYLIKYSDPQWKQRKKAKIDRNRASRAVIQNPGYLRMTGAYSMTIPGSPEQKYIDLPFTAEGTSTAAKRFHLCQIAQATGESGRIGAKVQCTRINCRFTLLRNSLSQAVTGLGASTRIILLIDKQANGALPTAVEILKNDDFYSYYNLNNTNRFIILKDKVITQNHSSAIQTASTTGVWNRPISFFKYSRKISVPITYNNTTGAVTEVKSQNLVMLMVSTDASSTLDGYTRVRYLDS